MAATVIYDSELMNHYVPAVPINDHHNFIALRDENDSPLVFSIGNNNKFYLTIADDNGNNHLQDLGARLGLTTKAQAFGATQKADGNILVVFSMAADPDAPGDLFALGPLKPADLRKSNQELQNKFLRRNQGQEKVRYERFYVSYGPGRFGKPDVVAVYRQGQDSEIAIIAVEKKGVIRGTDTALPQNVPHKSVTVMCSGNTISNPGVVYLYRAGGQQTLLFKSTKKSFGKHSEIVLKLPGTEDLEASAVATFTNQEGSSGVLVVCDKGLYLYDKINGDQPPTLVDTHDIYLGAKNLFVAQSGDHLSVWFINTDGVLGYHEGDRTNPKLFERSCPPVPLSSAVGDNFQFSAIIDPVSQSQRLLVAKAHGKIMVMEQAVDSRAWKETPFVAENQELRDEVMEIRSFNIRIKITDKDDRVLPEKDLRLSSSGWVTVIVNGRSMAISASGVAVKTDSIGTLTIIVPTDDISSYSFFIGNDGDSLFPNRIPIDPTRNLVDKLAGVTATTLKEARIGGKRLVEEGTDDKDLQEATNQIRELCNVMQELPDNASDASSDSSAGVAQSDIPGQSENSLLWDAWYWVVHQVNNVTTWVMKQVGRFRHFVITIAGKIWEFVLDTGARVMKAIEFVFDKIKVGFEKMFEWLGQFFKWKEVTETAASISDMATAFLTYLSGRIRSAADVVDDAADKFLDKLETSLKESANIPSRIQDTKPGASVSQAKGDKKISNALDSAPANWSVYQFNHGGIKDKIGAASEGAGGTPDSFYTESIEPILKGLEDVVKSTVGDIYVLYSANPNPSIGELLQVVGIKVLVGVLKTLKNVVTGLIRAGARIIDVFRDLLNTEIQVPLFSGLFKKFTSLKFTVLNVISILLAIPATWLSFLFTDKKPSQIANFKYEDMANSAGKPADWKAFTELKDWILSSTHVYKGPIAVAKIASFKLPKLHEPASTFDNVCTLIEKAVEIPLDPTAVIPDVRDIAWGISLGGLGMSLILGKSEITKQALPFIDALCAIVGFVVEQVIFGHEFAAEGNDHGITTLDVVLSLLSVVSAVATSVGQYMGPNPKTLIPAVVVSQTTGSELILKLFKNALMYRASA